MKKILIFLFSLLLTSKVHPMEFPEGIRNINGEKAVVLELSDKTEYNLSSEKAMLCKTIVNINDALGGEVSVNLPEFFNLQLLADLDDLLTHYFENNKIIDPCFIHDNFNKEQIIMLLNALNYLDAEPVLDQLADYYALFCIKKYNKTGMNYPFSKKNGAELSDDMSIKIAIKIEKILQLKEKLKKPFLVHTQLIDSIDDCNIASNGYLAITTKQNEKPLTIYDLTGIQVRPIFSRSSTFYSFCDNNRIALYNEDTKQLKIKSLINKKTLETIDINCPDIIINIIVSPDTNFYALYTNKGLYVYAKNNAEPIVKEQHMYGVTVLPKITFAPDGSYVAYGYKDRSRKVTLKLITLEDEKAPKKEYHLNLSDLTRIAISPNARYIVAYSIIENAVEVRDFLKEADSENDESSAIFLGNSINTAYGKFIDIIFNNNSCAIATPIYWGFINLETNKCCLRGDSNSSIWWWYGSYSHYSEFKNIQFQRFNDPYFVFTNHQKPGMLQKGYDQLCVFKQLEINCLNKLTIKQMLLINEIVKKKATIYVDNNSCPYHKDDIISRDFKSLKEIDDLIPLYNELGKIVEIKSCNDSCNRHGKLLFLAKLGSFGFGALLGGSLGYLGLKYTAQALEDYPFGVTVSTLIGGLAGLKLFSYLSGRFQ